MSKTNKTILLVPLFWIFFTINGQDLVINGVVKIDGEPMPHSTISFLDVASVTTNENGYFSRSLPNFIEVLKIEVPAGLSLLSPVEGTIVVSNAKHLYTILFTRNEKKIEASKDLHQYVNEIIESSQNSVIIDQKLDMILAKFDEMHQDKFSKEEINLLLTNERKLLEIKYAKANLLPLLTGAFDHYISRTRDLRDDFRRRGPKVFNDLGLNITELNKRIVSYSEAYEELNKSRSAFVANLEMYWADPYIKIKMTNLMSAALDNFHKGQVLKYNILLNDIDNYNQKTKGKRRRAEIQHDIDEYVEILSHNIDILERDKAAVVQQLMDSNSSL